MITENKIIFMTLFFSFLKNNSTLKQLIFSGKLSTTIIFKLCKFSVNLSLCFLSYRKYIHPLMGDTQQDCKIFVWFKLNI